MQNNSGKGTIFRVGDRVFDIDYGWGIVEDTKGESNDELYPVRVEYPTFGSIWYTKEGKFSINFLVAKLSFTEYNLVNGGFSQERPVPVVEKGQLVYVKFSIYGEWYMRYFSHFTEGGVMCVYNDQHKTGNTNPVSEYSLSNPLEER